MACVESWSGGCGVGAVSGAEAGGGVSTRVYVRKFDWDEARDRRAAGESVRSLAAEYGVSRTAIRRAIDPATYAQMAETTSRFMRSGTCVDCGGQCSRYHERCIPCQARSQATTARDGELQCMICREWKPDAAFPRNRSEKHGRRGRHGRCRSCDTKERQAYRERMKVPCVFCGSPTLPPSEKPTHGAAFPRCRTCSYARRVPGQVAA